jgi:uncharacterized caspase-like protein
MNVFFRAVAAVIVFLGVAAPAFAQGAEPRLALVLGNTEYAGAPAPTAANDAGLVAEALRQAGFDVTGAANLDPDSLRTAIQDFIAKVGAQGQGGVAFVYLAGRGAQYAGENYFLPVGAQLAGDADIAREGARVSELTRALSALQLKARIVVLDAARATPMLGGAQIAGGLQFVEADRGSLVAFNAAPGTIAPEEPAPYGTYARAFVELMHEGGVPVDEVFVRTRLRVNELSKGAIIPWHTSRLDQRVVFFEAAADAKPRVSMEQTANIRKRPIRDFPADEAYSVVIERDNIESYQDYVNAYPNAAQARRVRALLAARREARIWRDTYVADTPNAYWTYLRRYPRGPHAQDARRRLQAIRAEMEPPAQFDLYEYRDVPPPPPEEIVFVERRPVMLFDGGYDLPPPPPPPDYFLPPRRAEFYELAPPPPPPSYGYLPALGAAAVAVIAAPAIMRALKPVRPQGQYVQPNFGQVRNQQGRVQPAQQGGLQMLQGGQMQQLPPRANFGGRPQGGQPLQGGAQPAMGLQPLQGMGAAAPKPATPTVQPLPGATPATPGALPGVGVQPLPGMGGMTGMGAAAPKPATPTVQPLPGAKPATPGALPGVGGQPLPGMGGMTGMGAGAPKPATPVAQPLPGAKPATPGAPPGVGGQPLPGMGGMTGMGAGAPKPATPVVQPLPAAKPAVAPTVQPAPAAQPGAAQQRQEQQKQLQLQRQQQLQQQQEKQKLERQKRQQDLQQRQEQRRQFQLQRQQQIQQMQQQAKPAAARPAPKPAVAAPAPKPAVAPASRPVVAPKPIAAPRPAATAPKPVAAPVMRAPAKPACGGAGQPRCP